MSIDTEVAFRSSRRTPTPRRLPNALPGTHGENATVAEEFTLHYGLDGPRTIRPGARCRISDVDEASDLCRYSSGTTERALCSLSHFALDEDVRHGS